MQLTKDGLETMTAEQMEAALAAPIPDAGQEGATEDVKEEDGATEEAAEEGTEEEAAEEGDTEAVIDDQEAKPVRVPLAEVQKERAARQAALARADAAERELAVIRQRDAANERAAREAELGAKEREFQALESQASAIYRDLKEAHGDEAAHLYAVEAAERIDATRRAFQVEQEVSARVEHAVQAARVQAQIEGAFQAYGHEKVNEAFAAVAAFYGDGQHAEDMAFAVFSKQAAPVKWLMDQAKRLGVSVEPATPAPEPTKQIRASVNAKAASAGGSRSGKPAWATGDRETWTSAQLDQALAHGW